MPGLKGYRWLRDYTVRQLFWKAWHEIPEVSAAFVVGMIGIVGISIWTYREYQIPGYKYPKFKNAYCVYRSDDPLVKYLHNRDTPAEIEEFERESQPYKISPYN